MTHRIRNISMALTRRSILRVFSVASIVSYSGCTTFNANSQIAVVVYTNSQEEHSINIEIEKDDKTLFTQHLLVPPYGPNPNPIRTVVSSIPVSKGERLNVIGTIDGSQPESVPLIIDCRNSSIDLVIVRILSSGDIMLSDSCYKKK